ncbi:MAG: decarboxylase [Candidatus Woesearchaeota archaeon]
MERAHFTLSKSVILDQYDHVEKISDVVSYSSKTNPNVTPILEENTGCFFSLHLTNELENVKDMSRVLFLAQGLDEHLLGELFNKGIRNIAIDNEYDLKQFKKYLDTHDAHVERLFLRMKLKERSLRTEKYFVFGMESTRVNEEIRELWATEKIASLGVHVHRKTQNIAEWNLKEDLYEYLDEDVLEILDVINIGGGLPALYANTNQKVFKGIFRRIKEFKDLLSEKNIKLMVEPGRYIAAPAGKLRTRIMAKYENNIILNASVYNSDMDALIVPVKLLVEGELENGKGESYVLKGKTPCSMDLFRYKVFLDNPEIGDEIVFLNAGAYNFTTDFCNLETIETKVVE